MTGCSGLRFVEEEGRLSAIVEPTTVRSQLDIDSARNMLAQAGYGSWFELEGAIAALVQRYNAAEKDFTLQIAERRDGSFSLEIAPDAMLVLVSLSPPCGGKAVTPDDVYAALGEAGVTFGVDSPAVELLCKSTLHQRVTVATGKAPENGQDTRFELLVADTRDRTPRIDAHGLMDFRELGAIPMVEAEQPLMRRIPPTNGVSGHNVRGETLDPLPGRNETFAENLLGAYVSKDDPNLLLAVFNGQPVRCGNGVMIEQVLHVGDINVASGNISFNGTVHVDGEVLPGMKVHASGDIIVTGVVDAGELEAGGDIHVGGGIIAHAKVRAGGSVEARFVENAQVYAGTAITIEDMALQSDLQAINQIVVGTKSRGRGRLVGGSARAMLLVQAPVVGAAVGGVTSIQLGVNPVLETRYQDLLHRIEKQKEEEANLEKLIKYLSSHGDKDGMLERVKTSWQHAVQMWGRLLPERDELEKELALMASAQLVAGVGFCGALDITFGKKKLHVNQNFDAGSFLLDGEQIVFTTKNPSKKA